MKEKVKYVKDESYYPIVVKGDFSDGTVEMRKDFSKEFSEAEMRFFRLVDELEKAIEKQEDKCQ